MTLDQIPFDQLRVGMRVRSRATGRLGRIGALHPLGPHQSDDNEVDLHWDNGNSSGGMYHCWCDQIDLVDPE